MAVDRSGWCDHSAEDESPGEDVHPSGRARGACSQPGRGRPATAARCGHSRVEPEPVRATPQTLSPDDEEAQRAGAARAISGEILERAPKGVEQTGAAECPIKATAAEANASTAAAYAGHARFSGLAFRVDISASWPWHPAPCRGASSEGLSDIALRNEDAFGSSESGSRGAGRPPRYARAAHRPAV
jgi:hypothetical protein